MLPEVEVGNCIVPVLSKGKRQDAKDARSRKEIHGGSLRADLKRKETAKSAEEPKVTQSHSLRTLASLAPWRFLCFYLPLYSLYRSGKRSFKVAILGRSQTMM